MSAWKLLSKVCTGEVSGPTIRVGVIARESNDGSLRHLCIVVKSRQLTECHRARLFVNQGVAFQANQAISANTYSDYHAKPSVWTAFKRHDVIDSREKSLKLSLELSLDRTHSTLEMIILSCQSMQ